MLKLRFYGWWLCLLLVVWLSACRPRFNFDFVPPLEFPDTQLISPNTTDFNYIGRVDLDEPDAPLFAMTGSQIEFRFEGRVCKLHFGHLPNNTPPYNENYLRVELDGVERTIQLEQGEHIYAIDDSLKSGEHTVKVFKRTEAVCGLVTFLGVEIEDGKQMLTPPKLPKRKIEFIGNSISCGYGNEGEFVSDPYMPKTENGYMAYGAITARLLNAQYACVCYSGKGMYRNYDHTTTETVPKLYDKIYPQAGKKWDYSQWQPDVVVINLGTNDFATAPPPKEAFQQTYVEFIMRVHNNYPNAAIVCVDGPMLIDNWPESEYGPVKSRSLIQQYLIEVVSMAKANGVPQLYHFSLTPSGELGHGANWHPSIAQHEFNARELADFIRESMNW